MDLQVLLLITEGRLFFIDWNSHFSDTNRTPGKTLWLKPYSTMSAHTGIRIFLLRHKAELIYIWMNEFRSIFKNFLTQRSPNQYINQSSNQYITVFMERGGEGEGDREREMQSIPCFHWHTELTYGLNGRELVTWCMKACFGLHLVPRLVFGDPTLTSIGLGCY